jgi:hypothetical protein
MQLLLDVAQMVLQQLLQVLMQLVLLQNEEPLLQHLPYEFARRFQFRALRQDLLQDH